MIRSSIRSARCALLVFAALALVPGASSAQTTVLAIETAPDHSLKRSRTGLIVGLGVSIVPTVVGTVLTNRSGGSAEETGILLLLTGFIVGPAAGNVYAHDGTGALLSTGIRLAGLVLVGAAYSDRFEDSGQDRSQLGLAAVVLGSYGLSLLTIPASVRKYNRRHPTVSLAPSVNPNGGAAARLTLDF